LKKKVKEVKNFEKNLNFIIEGFIKNGFFLEKENSDDLSSLFKDFSIGSVYDPLLQNFPSVFYNEIIPKLKFLETIKVNFNSKIDYLKIKDKEILQDDIAKDYEVFLTLISFNENPSIFNSNINKEEQLKNLLEYKSTANFFFTKSLFTKSKKLNKYLVTEYIKQVNLEKGKNKLTHNLRDFKNIDLHTGILEKTDDNNEHKIFNEMKKVFSNLITIYYKMKKYKKCDEVITNNFIFFDQEQKDEKILYIKYKVLLEGFDKFDESKNFIEKILNLYSGSSKMASQYKLDLENLERKITEGKKKKNVMIKKMFKFE